MKDDAYEKAIIRSIERQMLSKKAVKKKVRQALKEYRKYHITYPPEGRYKLTINFPFEIEFD